MKMENENGKWKMKMENENMKNGKMQNFIIFIS
jgi:hypothetical protein